MDIEIEKVKQCPECGEWAMKLKPLQDEWQCAMCGATVEIN
jgi:ribosomal protein L37AE/L43A